MSPGWTAFTIRCIAGSSVGAPAPFRARTAGRAVSLRKALALPVRPELVVLLHLVAPYGQGTMASFFPSGHVRTCRSDGSARHCIQYTVMLM